MHRRSLLQVAVAGLLGIRVPTMIAPAFAQDAPAPFGFDAVVAQARAAATEPFSRPVMKMAPPFADLKYDAFRAIRFREDRRLFADGSRAFQMELLPPGYHFQDRIEINLVAADGRVQPVGFSADYFDFGTDYFPFPDGRAPGRHRRRHGLQRRALPLPDQPPGRLGRGRGVPGRQLLPRRRPRHAVRPLGARPRDRHRRAGPRGIPDLQELLDPRAAARRPRPAHPGAARQRVGRRRLRLRHRARHRHRHPRRGRPLPAPRDRHHRHGAADLDVLLRPGEPRERRGLPRRGARQRRPAHRQRPRRATLAAAAQPHASSRPRPSATRTRAPSG